MTELAGLQYSVEVADPHTDRGWRSLAFRLTLEGAEYEARIRRRDNPSQTFRILHCPTDMVRG